MRPPSYIITLLATLLFTILFFEKSLGLNVAIYGVTTVILLLSFKTNLFKTLLPKIVSGGLLVTSICYYLYASPLTLAISIASFLLLFGLNTKDPVKNLLYGLPNTVTNYFASIGDFFKSLQGRNRNGKLSRLGRVIRIVGVPLFVVLLFLAVYSMGSSFFSNAVGEFFALFEDIFKRLAKYIDIVAVFVGLLGFLFALLHSLQPKIASVPEINESDFLTRTKRKWAKQIRVLDLSTELKSGVFLFTTLSLLLSVLVFLEIKNVWFGFEWEGELLKEFVHEGTYILIFAILLSMLVTLYFFRKNLNFHPQNKALKTAGYVWISLNVLLVVSVFIRNYYYIQYFGLAYKRIGVVFFLVLCVVGLITILLKIKDRRTSYYITRVNSLAAYITLVSLCLVNWDVVIAKYNFSHYKTAFVHLPFMSNLSDKALPYLEIGESEIKEIEEKQTANIPFARKGYFKEVDYQNKINLRIESFKMKQQNQHWLERVWAEDRAMQMLQQK